MIHLAEIIMYILFKLTRGLMENIRVELVKYDMDKTKKRKRANFNVNERTEAAIITKLERIHKGEKVLVIHEIIWAADKTQKVDDQNDDNI